MRPGRAPLKGGSNTRDTVGRHLNGGHLQYHDDEACHNAAEGAQCLDCRLESFDLLTLLIDGLLQHGDLGVVRGLGKPPAGGKLGLQIPSRSLLQLRSRMLRRHV